MKILICTLPALIGLAVGTSVIAGPAVPDRETSLEPATRHTETLQRNADGTLTGITRVRERVSYFSEEVTEQLAPTRDGGMRIERRTTVTEDARGTKVTVVEAHEVTSGRLVVQSRVTEQRGANGSHVRSEELRDGKTGQLTLRKRVITTRDGAGATTVTEELHRPGAQPTVTRHVVREGTHIPRVR